MFIVDYFGFKHIKYSNILHILTFYTTPRTPYLFISIYSFPPISSGAIIIEFSSEFIFGTYGVSVEF